MKISAIAILLINGIASGQTGHPRAVIVGVRRYPVYAPTKPLSFANQDASLFEQYLKSGKAGKFQNGDLIVIRDEGATLVLQTVNRQGWWWYIPLHNDTVSVGVVAPFDYLFKGRGTHEETYEEEVERCPAVKQRVSPGRRKTGYFATKDYSYRSKEVAGDGWVLVGDAFGFLDPLYSSGVLLALKSGELAADAVVEGLQKGDVSAAQLGKWGPMFNHGVDRMRRLVCEYYDGFSFGQFVRNFPHLKGIITDLLIGDLFTERVDAAWQPMESLYPPEKKAIPSWTAGSPAEAAADKVNELFLPSGLKP